MFNAIMWLVRSGFTWKNIPSRYPPNQSGYSRFCKWREDGTLETVFHILNADADLENISTHIKAHPQSAGLKKGIQFRMQSIYWYKSWWKKYQNSCHCG